MISILTPSIRPEYLKMLQECLERQTFQDFEWLTEVGLRNRGFDLPKAMNRMLKRAKGDMIYIIQDCITIPDNFLEATKDKYPTDFVTFPLEKNGQFDWRKNRDGQIMPEEWESDLAKAPIQAFFDIGGYDEDYCQGWSWDNVEVAYRAKAAGYRFQCVNSIHGTVLDHDSLIKHPFRNKLKNNDARARQTKGESERGYYKKEYLI